MGPYDGDETRWKEWFLKFKAVAQEVNTDTYVALKWTEGEADEITEESIGTEVGESGTKNFTTGYNRGSIISKDQS